jgi:predicted  nucleic acid-binding Zn-ribbon protein
LESELDSEQRRHAETQKNMRKADRRLKEIAFQSDEDRKGQERLNEMIDKLNGKIKMQKRQIEEAVSGHFISRWTIIKYLLIYCFDRNRYKNGVVRYFALNV